MNREAWLTAMVEELRDHFQEGGYPLPEKVRVSVGWPTSGGLAKKKRTIGQCTPRQWATDGIGQLHISPLVATGVEAAAVLVHELIHDTIGCDARHGPRFRKAMKALGLEGKPTATHAGESLLGTLANLIMKVGDYPHSALTPIILNKQKGRQLKAVCEECDYIIRASRKTMDRGLPDCGVCHKPMVEPEADDEEGGGE